MATTTIAHGPSLAYPTARVIPVWRRLAAGTLGYAARSLVGDAFRYTPVLFPSGGLCLGVVRLCHAAPASRRRPAREKPLG